MLNDGYNKFLSAKPEPGHENSNLSSILNKELESIIKVLEPEDRLVLLKKILEVALVDLDNAVETLEDQKKPVPKFSGNLRQII